MKYPIQNTIVTTTFGHWQVSPHRDVVRYLKNMSTNSVTFAIKIFLRFNLARLSTMRINWFTRNYILLPFQKFAIFSTKNNLQKTIFFLPFQRLAIFVRSFVKFTGNLCSFPNVLRLNESCQNFMELHFSISSPSIWEKSRKIFIRSHRMKRIRNYLSFSFPKFRIDPWKIPTFSKGKKWRAASERNR